MRRDNDIIIGVKNPTSKDLSLQKRIRQNKPFVRYIYRLLISSTFDIEISRSNPQIYIFF